MKPKKAFTLIELLVVIAIIGILATISVLALNNARAKSRDAKRAGDVKQVQTALELFFNDKNRYPTTDEWAAGQIFSTSSNSTSTYMQIIPSAPTPNDGSCSSPQNAFSYEQTESGNSYVLSFCLGNNTGSISSGPKCLTPAGILSRACFECGVDTVPITSIAGHACNEGAPDYDKCTYNTVLINDQCWLKENLNIGSIISVSSNQTDNGTLEKYCYNNNSNNCPIYGAYYDWPEAMQYSIIEGSQGICPKGWHIPSAADWYAMENYLKDFGQTCNANRFDSWDCNSAGTKLKTGESSGFNALLAGYCTKYGNCFYQGSYAQFLTSRGNNSGSYFRQVRSAYSTVHAGYYTSSDGQYLSLRCIKN